MQDNSLHRRALNTPRKLQKEMVGQSRRKPKEQPASRGLVHKRKTRS